MNQAKITVACYQREEKEFALPAQQKKAVAAERNSIELLRLGDDGRELFFIDSRKEAFVSVAYSAAANQPPGVRRAGRGELLAGTDGAGQTAIVGTIVRVPQRDAHLNPPSENIELLRRAGRRLGGGELVVLAGGKVFVVPEL